MRSLIGVALIAAVLAGCQVVPSDIVRQIVPERTDYKTLEAAYHVLLERHVDKPGSEQLLRGALDGAEAYIKKPTEQKGANCGTLSIDRPSFSGSTESDLVKARESLDKAAAACAGADKTQLERAATDGMAKSMNECHTYYLDPDRAKVFNQPPQPYSGEGLCFLAYSGTQSGSVAGEFLAGGAPKVQFNPATAAGMRGKDRFEQDWRRFKV